MTLASPLRKVASKLMAKFGGTATIQFIAVGVYNPTTGQASESITSTELRGVLEDVRDREVTGLVVSTDKKLTIAALDVPAKPSGKDKVLISESVHQIVEVRTVEQDNLDITYELFIRL
jgi:hypothetical protein